MFSADRAFRNDRASLVVAGLTIQDAEYTLDLYAVDLDTGRGRRFVKGQSDTRDYIIGADGAPLLRELVGERRRAGGARSGGCGAFRPHARHRAPRG